MEPINGSSDDSSDNHIEEALDLLELCWFFDNLLIRRKPRMCSSSSDPCLSTVAHQVFDESPERVCSSETVAHQVFDESPERVCTSENGARLRRSLLRTPSLPSRIDRGRERSSKTLLDHGLLQKTGKPPCVERKEEGSQGRESGRRKVTRKPPHGNLLRTPSLPPCIGREKESGERETAAGIRSSTQPNLSELFPTRQEIIDKNSTVSQCEILINNDKMWRELLLQMRKRRNRSELESKEVQGFKDLGFTFDKKDINPTVVNIIPGLREKKEEELDSERIRRPYLSEAWKLQNLLPPTPKWNSKKSAEDMKQEIKFWARAVASNVH